jgi:hypothetical protein
MAQRRDLQEVTLLSTTMTKKKGKGSSTESRLGSSKSSSNGGTVNSAGDSHGAEQAVYSSKSSSSLWV